MSLEGRTAIVTGAAGGIGLAVSKQLIASGATVVLGDVRRDAVEHAAFGLDTTGERAIPVAYDAASDTGAESLVEIAKEKFGSLDYLVVGAGIYRYEPLPVMTERQWFEMLAVNLHGAAKVCLRAIDYLSERSSVVLITSIAAHRGGEVGSAHYAASKGGLLAFGRSMAKELAPRVRVNMVSPGLIETEMTKALIATRGADFIEATPMKRLGTACDVANAVTFLLSDRASFITGQVMHVNGGSYIAG